MVNNSLQSRQLRQQKPIVHNRWLSRKENNIQIPAVVRIKYPGESEIIFSNSCGRNSISIWAGRVEHFTQLYETIGKDAQTGQDIFCLQLAVLLMSQLEWWNFKSNDELQYGKGLSWYTIICELFKRNSRPRSRSIYQQNRHKQHSTGPVPHVRYARRDSKKCTTF